MVERDFRDDCFGLAKQLATPQTQHAQLGGFVGENLEEGGFHRRSRRVRTGKLTANGGCLFILLFSFELSFFLWTELGLFLLFPFTFIFTSLITHV